MVCFFEQSYQFGYRFSSVIAEGAWIGAGATILPGVRIGRYAVVGAAAVVTKDVPDYGVVVGSPAKVIKMFNPEKFPKDPDH